MRNAEQNELDGLISRDIVMNTYTAGEDGSRLASAAKEFGLMRHRQPRTQIRERTTVPLQTLRGFFYERMLDPGFTEVRMRQVYSAHSHSSRKNSKDNVILEYDTDESSEGEKEVRRLGLGRLPSWNEDGEDIEDPHLAGMGGDLISTVLGIIKGMVGPAILYLPHGFANAGYLLAVPILMISTILFLCSSKCLLDSWKLESSKEKERTVLSYPELAYRALGPKGETMVKVGISMMQSGICLTYLIFVPQNLQKSCFSVFGLDLPASYFMIVMLVFQIPLSWIRDIRKLTVTNLLANILIMYGLCTCLAFAFSNAILPSEINDTRDPITEIIFKIEHLEPVNSEWFLFIGTSVLLFEGTITLLVPLQESVFKEKDRERFPQVFQTVILGIIAFYTFFGLVCWMSFGQDVRTVMTTSLPEGVWATTVQLAYSMAVIFTFPLQHFPSLEITCEFFGKHLCPTRGKNNKHVSVSSTATKRNIIASFIVCTLSIIAIFTMDSLDKVVSLMGSLVGCPLAFIFPPLIHNNLTSDVEISENRRLGNYIVALCGCAAMAFASYTTLISW